MGLQSIEAHNKGDLKKALSHYQRALDQGDTTEIIYQNFGALLRDLGKIEDSKNIYETGLSLHPKSKGIRRNYSNLLRSISPTKSLQFELDLISEHLSSAEKPSSKDFTNVLELLLLLDCYCWAYQLCLFVYYNFNSDAEFLVLFFKIITDDRCVLSTEADKTAIQLLIENNLDSLSPVEFAQFKFSIAWLQTERRDFKNAINTLYEARKILDNINPSESEQRDKINLLNNVNSWNMANILLPEQDFLQGWDLFEYGLRARAKGLRNGNVHYLSHLLTIRYQFGEVKIFIPNRFFYSRSKLLVTLCNLLHLCPLSYRKLSMYLF